MLPHTAFLHTCHGASRIADVPDYWITQLAKEVFDMPQIQGHVLVDGTYEKATWSFSPEHQVSVDWIAHERDPALASPHWTGTINSKYRTSTIRMPTPEKGPLFETFR
ncbi:MAG: hypothetical protein ACI8Y7_000035 [Candidatus Woesearchaeota archaeon]|jgi:hypothetical protein